MGDVGLPALIGQRRLEAHIGAARSLAGLGGDEAPSHEHAPHARGRRSVAVATGEVIVDGLGAGIETVACE